MRFEGTFLNKKGKKIDWWFEASSEEALLKHLQEQGWRIVSLKRILKKEELISEADVYQGLWIVIRHLWMAVNFVISFPFAFILVTLDWLGKRERERHFDCRQALKEAERILKGDRRKTA